MCPFGESLKLILATVRLSLFSRSNRQLLIATGFQSHFFVGLFEVCVSLWCTTPLQSFCTTVFFISSPCFPCSLARVSPLLVVSPSASWPSELIRISELLCNTCFFQSSTKWGNYPAAPGARITVFIVSFLKSTSFIFKSNFKTCK